jgi:hypothetical protein
VLITSTNPGNPRGAATARPLDGELERMRLPYMRKAAPEPLATAKAQRWDPAEVASLTAVSPRWRSGREVGRRRPRTREFAWSGWVAPTGRHEQVGKTS